jgi:hypothetical protein
MEFWNVVMEKIFVCHELMIIDYNTMSNFHISIANSQFFFAKIIKYRTLTSVFLIVHHKLL